MDLQHLKTFAVVARERSITRASARLHLSQPAVSAHVKALEDTLGLALFARTPKGMTLTSEGTRLLAKAEHTLDAHRELVAEAARIKGHIAGHLRLGTSGSASHATVGRLLAALAARAPDVEVAVIHGSSRSILDGLRAGTLDAGIYNDGGPPDADLATVELARFTTYVAAPVTIDAEQVARDWSVLAEQPWIYPAASACCGRTAESLFAARGFRPRRVVNVDSEAMTRTLIANGLGVGLLHAHTAHEASARGEVTLLGEAPELVRIRFAHLWRRAQDPMLALASSILRASA